MKIQKNEKGITLVALVVTIVVLLILAGVTIMYVMSDNGIFGKAQEAGNKSDKAAVEEATFLAVSGLYPQVYYPETDNLTTELEKSFGENLPAKMTVKTKGSIEATKGSVSSLEINTYVITYKNVDYKVSYSSADGVVVLAPGDEGYGS